MKTRFLFAWAVLLLICSLLTVSCGGDDDDNDSSAPSDDSAPADDSASDDSAADDSADDVADDTADDDAGYPEPFDPSQVGPYAVGNRTVVYIDEAHDDYASRGKRTLLTEVWYPAEDWTRDLPVDHVYNFLGRWYGLFKTIGLFLLPPEERANFERETHSVRDAKIYTAAGPFPLVLMSHGNAGIRFQGMSIAEYLASHGYIVAAPDHIGNAVFVTLPDRLSIYNPILTPFEFVKRIQDMFFLIDHFTDLNEDDPEGFFTGMLDMDRIAEIGHSFGAVTVPTHSQLDPRVKAVVPLAGFQFPIFPEGFDTPFMWFIGLEDHTLDDYEPLARLDYLIDPTPKFQLGFINGGHYTFTDACNLIPSLLGEGDGCGSETRHDTGEPFDFIEHDKAFHLINTYITAFFDYVLKGYDGMEEYLTTNMDPDEIELSYDLGKGWVTK